MDKRIAEIKKANAKLLIDIIYANDTADFLAVRKAQEAITKAIDELEAEYGVKAPIMNIEDVTQDDIIESLT